MKGQAVIKTFPERPTGIQQHAADTRRLVHVIRIVLQLCALHAFAPITPRKHLHEGPEVPWGYELPMYFCQGVLKRNNGSRSLLGPNELHTNIINITGVGKFTLVILLNIICV